MSDSGGGGGRAIARACVRGEALCGADPGWLACCSSSAYTNTYQHTAHTCPSPLAHLPCRRFQGVAAVLLALYCVAMLIIFMNLLIATMNDTYERVKEFQVGPMALVMGLIIHVVQCDAAPAPFADTPHLTPDTSSPHARLRRRSR